MKTLLMTLLAVTLVSAPTAAADGFKNDDERAIYALGYNTGKNFEVLSLSPAELKSLNSGVSAGAANKPPAVRLDLYLPRIQELAMRRISAAAAPLKEAGKAYAEKFAKEPGAKPIPEGGWYKITEEGKGDLATMEDTLMVHYRGTHLDGSEFDSSYKRDTPYPVNLKGGVIPCWLNVLKLLKAGTKAKIVCPSDVAYSDKGRSGIKGGETLLFDIEFVEIVKPVAPKAGDKPVKK